jgi:lysophospholipase L1-like esterase
MRICFIGDSFVNGTNDPLCLGWTGRVCAAARARGGDLTLYNLGIRRDTSRDIAARWHAECAARLPDDQPGLLVFSFGVNDCTEDSPGRLRVEPPDTLATAREMLARAQAWRPTLMVGPPPIPDEPIRHRTAALSQALATLCSELGVPFLNVHTPLSTHAVWLDETARFDGAHPAAGGYDALAALVEAWPAWRAAVG